MNKKHSDLEMFLRKLMFKLGLGYQCYYKNRAKNTHRQGTPGHWSIEIWDQRPGHYTKRTIEKDGPWNWSDCSGARTDPTQKWYNNQHTDCRFEIVGPEYHGVGAEHKDDFMKWLLFEYNIFEEIGKRIKDFKGGSIEGIIMFKAIKGDENYDKFEKKLLNLKDEFESLKEKYE